MNLHNLEERRLRRLSGKERVRYTPNTPPPRFRPSNELIPPPPPIDPPKAEVPEVAPKWRRNGKPIVEIVITDEHGVFARTMIPRSKIGAWAQFMQEHYDWLENK